MKRGGGSRKREEGEELKRHEVQNEGKHKAKKLDYLNVCRTNQASVFHINVTPIFECSQ